jgi:hypothetical protein
MVFTSSTNDLSSKLSYRVASPMQRTDAAFISSNLIRPKTSDLDAVQQGNIKRFRELDRLVFAQGEKSTEDLRPWSASKPGKLLENGARSSEVKGDRTARYIVPKDIRPLTVKASNVLIAIINELKLVLLCYLIISVGHEDD